MNYFEAFVNDCKLRGLKPQSIANYKNYALAFITFIADREPKIEIRSWLSHYASERTQKTAWVHTKVYFGWLERSGLGIDWTKNIRIRFAAVPQEPTLTPDDFRRLTAAIPATPRGRRDRALYTLLFFTGARRDAVRLLKRPAINISDRIMRIKTKRGKEMFLTIPVEAAKELNTWLAWSAKLNSEYAFPSITHPEKPIDPNAVTHRLPIYAAAAGFTRRVYVHLLRHSFATELYKSGTALDVIQDALGHSNITTTQAYVRRLASGVRVREAVDRVFH